VAPTLPVLVEPVLPEESALPDALAPLEPLDVTPVVPVPLPMPVLADVVPVAFGEVELHAASTSAHANGMIHLVM
jgi:hypothetical protein